MMRFLALIIGIGGGLMLFAPPAARTQAALAWGSAAGNLPAIPAALRSAPPQSAAEAPPPQSVPAPLAAPQATSATLTASGDFGAAVQIALNANNGAIQNFVIAPGQTWSFGRSIKPISAMGPLPTVGGVPAGGWCDLSALYVEVADQLGLESHFPPHDGDHSPRFPGIWLSDANDDGDLTITNTRSEPIAFHTIIDGDTFRVEAGVVAPAAPQPSAQPSTCPVSPCWQSGTGYSSGHPGIDLGATLGQPVYATMDGVAHTSETWPCGNGLSITNGAVMTLMCHLSAFSVADGAAVHAGDQVAQAGSTGQSTGPHVHFEIRQDGINIDPSGVLGQ